MIAVASGLSPSFVWPGSGGGSALSAGLSQFGNARMSVATNSAVTGGYQDGYLLLNRNHISIHHIGSTWTSMLGHANMIEHVPSVGFTAASQVSARWVTQSGSTAITGATGTASVTFPTSYSETAPPFVHMVSQPPNLPSLNSTYGIQLTSVTTVGFSAVFSALDGTAPGATIFWESDGTILL